MIYFLEYKRMIELQKTLPERMDAGDTDAIFDISGQLDALLAETWRKDMLLRKEKKNAFCR